MDNIDDELRLALTSSGMMSSFHSLNHLGRYFYQ